MYNKVIDLDDIPSWIYSGGEVGIQAPDFPECNLKGVGLEIHANINSSDKLMKLFQVLDYYKSRVDKLVFKYFPYARQDRVQPGKPNSCKLIQSLINSINGHCDVEVWDPHSKVCVNYASYKAITHPRSFKEICAKIGIDPMNTIVVIPDEGATNRCEFLPGVGKTIQFSKIRNSLDGKLSGFKLESDLNGLEITSETNFLFYDDICDGGGTFIGVLEVLKKEMPYPIDKSIFHLYTTHGIYSNNAINILPNHFSTISCANNLNGNSNEKFPIIV